MRLDRETALALLKGVIACTTAWLLAAKVFGSSHATFAAFSALMLVEITIADSVAKAVRYTAAMLAGIGLAGAAVWVWGVAVWLFPAILVVALVIGRWHRLGSQGINVAVAAIFAYGAFALPSGGASAGSPLPSIAGMVLLGAGVALVVTLVIAPPLRYRSARYAVESVSGSMVDLLSDMVDGLASGDVNEDDARDWRWRADALPNKAAQARHTLDHAVRTTKLNLRRLLVRTDTGVAGHRVTINALERIGEELRWVATGVVRAVARDESGAQHDEFLRRFGDLLAAVRDAVATAGEMHTVTDFSDRPLAEEADRCRSAFDELTEHVQSRQLDRPTQWAIFGGLYTDAERLCDEIASARDAYATTGRSGTVRPA
ncbi:FUSC family protein [Mycolicibacterium celeriflavum]|uniref:FUSC family protein n=1 Tax=Mycolicibacterium celeriflavum TaxID=1249101 RepID=UPI003CEABAF2